VIGATNFPESLDPALIRPGRFDRHVNVDLPDIRGRKAILDHYLTTIVAEADDEGNIICDTDAIARTTPGSSGADLANMINAAALKASTDGKEFVTQLDLEYARDKITMGAEQTSAFITEENKKNTAYHEAGHAIVCMKTPGANTIHKATVIPRGQSLGMVQQLMEGDQKSKSMKQMLAYMDVCMGGRIAEEYINGKQNVTSGASQDLRQATATAQRMVMLFGMSEKVGKVSIRDLNMVSPKTRQLIDEEVKRLTDESYARATACIKKYSKEHKIIAEALIEYETLSGEELHDLIQGKKIRINNPISAEERAKRIANANIL
jgi:ATP-dependent metalloprotease